MNEEKITVKLTPAQRKLLLDKVMILNEDLERIVSVALKRGRKYEISMTLDDLDELCGNVAFEANHTEDTAVGRKLDTLHEYLDDCLMDAVEETDEDESMVSIKNVVDVLHRMLEVPDEDDYDEDDTDEDGAENGFDVVSEASGSVYVFKVALEGRKRIWRRIAVRGNQTLDDLHEAIYEAFDRDDEHLYSFYFSNATGSGRAWLTDAVEYTHPYNCEEGGFLGDEEMNNAAKTRIGTLKLKPGRKFKYLFDFGDSWWHDITVEQTDGEPEKGRYPRVIDKGGKSPEQYPDY